MGKQEWVDDREVPLGESRAAVLGLLRAADTPLGAQEVAARAGVHPNTARFHLDGLADAGLAERHIEERDQPGRPRVMYRACRSEAASGRRSYRLLAEILTSLVTNALPDPAHAAVEAGRIWGAYLTDRPAPFERVGADDAIERLARILMDVGFGVETAGVAQPPQIRLLHCPFKEIAEHSQEIVCSLHLGLMQGSLAELRAPLSAQRLEPLVQPNLCHAYLIPNPSTPNHGDDEKPSRPTRTGG